MKRPWKRSRARTAVMAGALLFGAALLSMSFMPSLRRYARIKRM